MAIIIDFTFDSLYLSVLFPISFVSVCAENLVTIGYVLMHRLDSFHFLKRFQNNWCMPPFKCCLDNFFKSLTKFIEKY